MEPTRLGPYVIRARIGRGGMGAVYEAEEEGSGATVAVKTLAANLGDDAGVRRRFEAEIEALKALEHPGIVRLLAYGEEDGLPYFAMELVRGRSLEEILRGGRKFTWRETLDVALEVTRALKHAHDHGVVHRDLKPANILVADAPTPGATVKLADFGIARLFGDGGHTVAGTIVGTAEYMAPEQAAGQPTDHRADFYALGLVMFAMLTGRPPFRGAQAAEVIQRQRLEPPPRVSQLAAEVPADLDELIDRLLAKDPAKRPATALALGRLLTAIDEVHAADPPPHATAIPAPPDVDLLAETAAMPAAQPARGALPVTQRDVPAAARTAPGGATVRDGGARHRQPATEVAPERAAAAAPPARTRFTTVEEVHRAARAEADRVRRRDTLWRTLAALATAGLLVAGGIALFRPRTADELHARILAIASADDADLRDARPLIEEFLARHAGDPRAAEIRELDRTLDLDALEKRARRRPLPGRELPPLERDYRAALAREAESPAASVALLEALITVHGRTAPAAGEDPTATADRDLWLALARRQIERLAPAADRERADDVQSAQAALAEAARLARQAAADPAGRARLEARRRELLESVVAMYAARPHADAAVTEARRLLAAQTDDVSDP